eukprot:Plantae.Rhodophyta-Purpureofilum_apyrenoidigerum.ctg17058.p1 GENE.Plantae.Rhodophyta-Purpureofilum_apyrenoidigerum.ctg17058~~Plantae.Rhodophyta-Purpureofilum_apyrenoidigerum.ctg17058.p1  ORF type:complete len:282 (-),score=44.53 Plantae.Rhodophyta-Purpureofilum_apyrenoidigerum.ctg17058:148-993(-)
MEVKSQWKVADGTLYKCVHSSRATGTDMTFSIFVPGGLSAGEKVPGIYYLSGLTCTDDNFCQKAGAFLPASKHRIALIAPDTSPRGSGIEGEDESSDFGTGAGFYLNATVEPWSKHYRMYDYVVDELPALVTDKFPVDPNTVSIMGHSMGGHGALTVAMKNPEKYRSVSAFSAICNPINCPWGDKALKGYLGDDMKLWKEYDATELMNERGPFPFKILLDQGTGDQFYESKQLLPENLRDACDKKGQQVDLNLRDGYDHSYFFISTYIPQHIDFHAAVLRS